MKVRAHLDRIGFSIPAAAENLGISEGTLRRAVDKGQIKVVEFGGLRRIPAYEIERIKDLLGLPVTAEIAPR